MLQGGTGQLYWRRAVQEGCSTGGRHRRAILEGCTAMVKPMNSSNRQSESGEPKIRPIGKRQSKESKRRALDSRAPPVEGGADGCKARALSV